MAQLTPREREIVSLLMQGRTTREIASELCVSQSTVKTHRHHVLAKSGSRNAAELAAKVAGEGE